MDDMNDAVVALQQFVRGRISMDRLSKVGRSGKSDMESLEVPGEKENEEDEEDYP
jgi:hypothetical protein